MTDPCWSQATSAATLQLLLVKAESPWWCLRRLWQSGFDVLVCASKWQGCVSLIRKRDRGEKIFTLDEEGENRDDLGCSERN